LCAVRNSAMAGDHDDARNSTTATVAKRKPAAGPVGVLDRREAGL